MTTLCFLTNLKDRKVILLPIYRNGHGILMGDAAELRKHRDCKIWPCGGKFILFYCSYLAHKCTSFYIKITAYYLPFKFESQNEDRWSNFAKIFIFVLSNGVFPMLLTENTTNDTCQSNLRGAWNDVRGDTKIEVIEREFPSVYILSVTRIPDADVMTRHQKQH